MVTDRQRTSRSGRPRRVVAVVQARLGSVRFPRKVIATALGRPLLTHLLERLGRAQEVDQIVLAIPDSSMNDELASFAIDIGVACSRGSEGDVLDRVYGAAASVDATIVVRITADCPLVDPALVDRLVCTLIDQRMDVVVTGNSYPDGFDVEVCTIDALRRAWQQATEPYDREHVMPFVRRDPVNKALTVESEDAVGSARVTLDDPEDLGVLESVFQIFGHNHFSLGDVVTLIREQPALFAANQHLSRNEGAAMGAGQKLWRRAKRVIPGGNMLLSKRSEMHLPEGWPAYFSRASGCRVWDLDDNEFIDVGYMGVGTNILGYGHPKVDEAVRRVVDAGNMSTLNCPEEVALAERLIELHPWAAMARFTRSGGEACAVAVRIARAASGRDKVAFCGYHGWQDWYLSANLGEESALDGHLLPGLQPLGVPRALVGSAIPFAYNDLPAVQALLEQGDVGVVFMEVQRGTAPIPGFLEGVRALASAHGAVLVFDECTSGFRKVLGGLHLHYGVEPDVAVFSKALGNGYAISAVIGREAVMQSAQDTFISSTFWTERIGPSAALAALSVMAEEDAPARIDAIGLQVQGYWCELAADAGLPLQVGGMPALSTFAVPQFESTAVRTYVTQQLLSDGFLAGAVIYISIALEEAVLDAYLERLASVFRSLAGFASTDELVTHLPAGLAQSGFHRLA